VSDLHCKDMKLPEIIVELASVYHDEAFHANRVQYWFHEFKLHRSDLSDRPSSSRPPLKIAMREFCKFQKLSRGIRFERSLRS
jgi:hypothetical protein